jgi:hypothetical protein
LIVSPAQIYIPSGVKNHTADVTIGLKWWAQLPSEGVAYSVEHLRSAAMKLSDGWYGSDGIKVYSACDVTVNPTSVTFGGELQNGTQSLQVRGLTASRQR